MIEPTFRGGGTAGLCSVLLRPVSSQGYRTQSPAQRVKENRRSGGWAAGSRVPLFRRSGAAYGENLDFVFQPLTTALSRAKGFPMRHFSLVLLLSTLFGCGDRATEQPAPAASPPQIAASPVDAVPPHTVVERKKQNDALILSVQTVAMDQTQAIAEHLLSLEKSRPYMLRVFYYPLDGVPGTDTPAHRIEWTAGQGFVQTY